MKKNVFITLNVMIIFILAFVAMDNHCDAPTGTGSLENCEEWIKYRPNTFECDDELNCLEMFSILHRQGWLGNLRRVLLLGKDFAYWKDIKEFKSYVNECNGTTYEIHWADYLARPPLFIPIIDRFIERCTEGSCIDSDSHNSNPFRPFN